MAAQQEAPMPFQQLSSAALHPDSTITLEGITLPGALWTRLVKKISLVVQRDGPRKSGQLPNQDVLHVARNMQKSIVTLISNWPGRLHSMLRDVQAHAPQTTSIQKTFGRLYRTLYVDFPEADFDWLRQGFESYLNTNWQGLLCARNRRLQEATITAHPRVALKEIATQTGISSLQATRLARKNVLSAVGLSLSSTRTAWTVRAEDSPQLQQQEFMTLREASRFTGIPRARLRTLVEEKILQPALYWQEQGKTHRSWIFQKSALNQILCVPSQEMNSPRDPVDLRRLLQQWQMTPDEFCELIRKVQDGTIACQHSASGHALDSGQVRDFISHARQADSSLCFSVDQAARHFGIKQQIAYDLVKSGLLKSHIDPIKGARITSVAITEFEENYISLAELARMHKTSPKSFLAKIPARPACGPSVDGSRKYYFLKEEVCDLIMPNQSPLPSIEN